MLWIAENYPTILAALVVAVIVAAPVVLRLVRRKKVPAGGCSGCSKHCSLGAPLSPKI